MGAIWLAMAVIRCLTLPLKCWKDRQYNNWAGMDMWDAYRGQRQAPITHDTALPVLRFT